MYYIKNVLEITLVPVECCLQVRSFKNIDIFGLDFIL